MAHPLSKSLSDKKFYKYGCLMFSTFFFLYSVFIVVFTITAARITHPQKYYNDFGFTFDNGSCENVSRLIGNRSVGSPGMKGSVDDGLKTTLWILIILLWLKNSWIIIGFIQVHLTKIFTFLLELIAILLSLAFIWDAEYQEKITMRCPIQWQCGAFGLFVGYLGLLYYIQYIPFIGMYVMMLKITIIRFMFFLPVLICLIFGFGIAFYMLFQYNGKFDIFPSHALSEIGIFKRNFQFFNLMLYIILI